MKKAGDSRRFRFYAPSIMQPAQSEDFEETGAQCCHAPNHAEQSGVACGKKRCPFKPNGLHDKTIFSRSTLGILFLRPVVIAGSEKSFTFFQFVLCDPALSRLHKLVIATSNLNGEPCYAYSKPWRGQIRPFSVSNRTSISVPPLETAAHSGDDSV